MKRTFEGVDCDEVKTKRQRLADPDYVKEVESHIASLVALIQTTNDTGEKERLMAMLEEQASIGCSSACFYLGSLLRTEGKDDQAIEMFQKAADLGHNRARFNWARCLHLGLGLIEDKKKALELFLICAEDHGMPEAYYKLGYIYRTGDGVDKDLEKAFQMCKIASDKDHILARINLAGMFFHGEGVEKDRSQSLELYKSAADSGNATAQYNYGLMKMTGEACSIDLEEALKYIHLAAEGGYPSALHALALRYGAGDGVPLDLEKAFQFYLTAANKGHKKSQFQLAKMYEVGSGTEKNTIEALRWYFECAKDIKKPKEFEFN